jgi:hypothetical protein
MTTAAVAVLSSKKDAAYVAREAVAILAVQDDHIIAGEVATAGLTYKYYLLTKRDFINLSCYQEEEYQ